MDWKKYFKDWKLAVALALIVAICGHTTPHIEPQFYKVTPSTTSGIQVSGANVSAGMSSWSNHNHPWTNLP
jgi:hypothetical protein